MAKEIQQTRHIGSPIPFLKETKMERRPISMGSHLGGDASGRDRFRGLCTAGIPSKRSVKTEYLQDQRKEKVDLVHQKPPAKK